MKNSNQKQQPIPLAYFITFTCYGTWLHGGKDKSVDKENNTPLSPYLPLNKNRELSARSRLQEEKFLLDMPLRLIILSSIKATCSHRNWNLLAAHVRTNHVHLVIHANTTPEIIMRDIKSYSSRELNRHLENKRDRYWTRHGSTRYLWKSEHVYRAIQYVVLEQGNQGAVGL